MANQFSRTDGGRRSVVHDRVSNILRHLRVAQLIRDNQGKLWNHANTSFALPNVTHVDPVRLEFGVYLFKFTPRTRHTASSGRPREASVSRTWTGAVASKRHIEDL